MGVRDRFFAEMEKQPNLPPDYNINKLPFMTRPGPQKYESEPYVTCPPALVVQDKTGAIWTLGFDQGGWRTEFYEFDIVRNGSKTGEFASIIEYRSGVLRIFGEGGWRSWSYSGKRFL